MEQYLLLNFQTIKKKSCILHFVLVNFARFLVLILTKKQQVV